MLDLHLNDGVAYIARGDTICVVYAAPARLHRSRWLYDAADRLAEQNPEGILALLIVLSTADPPDAPTRAENAARLRKLGSGIRKFVTVPVGDLLWHTLVRTIMRGMSIIQGQHRSHPVLSSIDRGLECLFEAAGPRTPRRPQLEQDIVELFHAVGAEPPKFSSRAYASK